mmetsp:Transcript_47292/g.73907  ORF Transcript_47292/g.73907 Transcript_47292/m.73907 type:complete len:95 (+) Transcript_47292:179-463(+)
MQLTKQRQRPGDRADPLLGVPLEMLELQHRPKRSLPMHVLVAARPSLKDSRQAKTFVANSGLRRSQATPDPQGSGHCSSGRVWILVCHHSEGVE